MRVVMVSMSSDGVDDATAVLRFGTGWSHSWGLNIFLFILSEVFGIEVCIGIVRKEASTADVFAGFVGFNAVGLADIVGYGTEVIRVRCRCDVYRDYPLEAVTGGAGEEQLCLEIWVIK